ncbi:hypothetical protein [Loktanella sp. M215]|uniref:hypothetical protein n=1 Tax=Loktanella sp. M215 TaxID=2675431 RepID=UPI001F3C776D|nr:hypothetical protein [Loktanella sp. M215]MCF7699832.1 hypothetical protein [Loktanella sp. M215]
MQNQSTRSFAIAAADQMIADRFQCAYGTSTVSEYLDHLDHHSTAHLATHLACRVNRTAGQQRRKSEIRFDGDGRLVIGVPMNDPRTNKTRHATTDFLIWIDLMESGADGAWVYNHKTRDRRAGQVRCSVPLKGNRSGPDRAAVARIIANAKSGQRAQLLDHDPFNLRRANIYLLNQIAGTDGRKGFSKTDTLANMLDAVNARSALVGKNYDYDFEVGQ